jgi:tRNA threonylcarbamoyladenosine modification (KEOPS) complex Cgi121 subunit
MELGRFPCIKWIKDISSNTSVLQKFLKIRPSGRWLMLGDHAAQSNRQLWTAWHCSERRFKRNKSLARNVDAEFIRYLAGTHHVSDAFQRAGLSDDANNGWLVYLPECDDFSDGMAFPKTSYSEIFENESLELLELLNLELSEELPSLSISNANILGLESDNIDIEDLENSLIGFILSSEFNS